MRFSYFYTNTYSIGRYFNQRGNKLIPKPFDFFSMTSQFYRLSSFLSSLACPDTNIKLLCGCNARERNKTPSVVPAVCLEKKKKSVWSWVMDEAGLWCRTVLKAIFLHHKLADYRRNNGPQIVFMLQWLKKGGLWPQLTHRKRCRWKWMFHADLCLVLS